METFLMILDIISIFVILRGILLVIESLLFKNMNMFLCGTLVSLVGVNLLINY